MPRSDGRRRDELRPLKIKRRFTRTAPGSVWIQAGGTTVLCTASIEEKVPDWMKGKGRGWVTAEYNMLPGSTSPRKRRDRDGKVDGRTTEIQRLIGRSLRAIIDLDALGERSVTVDCDVLEADGGTRTLSITGAFLALVDAIQAIPKTPVAGTPAGVPVASGSPTHAPGSPSGIKRFPLRDSVAAVSVGVVKGEALLDLCYVEDVDAEVDMNVVMTGSGRFIEIQGTGEEATFSEQELHQLIKLARGGIGKLTELQQKTLGKAWPF